METLNDILGYPNRKIYQDDSFFSFSLDSVMLANFVTIRLRDQLLLDLGTGNAVIPLILSLRCDKKIVGVEIQSKVATLAQKSVDYNKLSDQIDIVNLDMKDYLTDVTRETFDVVVCNPPYFKVNKNSYFNDSKEKCVARHEIAITLDELLTVAKGLLKNNGTFVMVHRPERLLEIFDLFRKNHIEPKKIRFVYGTIDKESTLVLIEGTKNGKAGLKIEPPFLMYQPDGRMTEEYEKMLVEVKS